MSRPQFAIAAFETLEMLEPITSSAVVKPKTMISEDLPIKIPRIFFDLNLRFEEGSDCHSTATTENASPLLGRSTESVLESAFCVSCYQSRFPDSFIFGTEGIP